MLAGRHELAVKERGDAKMRGVEDLYRTKAFAGENDWRRQLKMFGQLQITAADGNPKWRPVRSA